MECKLICRDDAVEKITRKWSECVSNILHLGGVEVSDVKTEKDYFEAIKIIDRHLCPSGLIDFDTLICVKTTHIFFPVYVFSLTCVDSLSK